MNLGGSPGGRDGELGAGTVLAVSVMAAACAAMLLVAPIVGVSVARQRAAAAADASALAAADVASGGVPGEPCPVAARVADAGGAALADCVVDGAIVTVTASVRWLGLDVSMRARAGPPPETAGQ